WEAPCRRKRAPSARRPAPTRLAGPECAQGILVGRDHSHQRSRCRCIRAVRSVGSSALARLPFHRDARHRRCSGRLDDGSSARKRYGACKSLYPTSRIFLASGASPTLGDCASTGSIRSISPAPMLAATARVPCTYDERIITRPPRRRASKLRTEHLTAVVLMSVQRRSVRAADLLPPWGRACRSLR